jgi:hypothetical protein
VAYCNILYKIFRAANVCAMVQAVSRQPIAAGARILSQISLCCIYGGHSGRGTGLSSGTSALLNHCYLIDVPAPWNLLTKK